MKAKTVLSWAAPNELPHHLSELMPATERQAIAAKASPKARAESWAGRTLLRALLWQCHGEAVARSAMACRAQGALYLPEYPALFINISHTVALVAAVVSETAPAGIDVEKIDPQLEPMAIAHRFFHAQEIQRLQALESAAQSDLFFDLWTAKEAAAKSLGLGLGLSFPSFYIQPNSHRWTVMGLANVETVCPLVAPQGFKAAIALAGVAGSHELQTYAPTFITVNTRKTVSE